MNNSAERHLRRAESYLGRGDSFYGKAADEIIAAKDADPMLSNREIGERFGRNESWVRKIVAWRTSSPQGGEMPPIDWQRGPKLTAKLVTDGLENEDVRQAVLETDRGLAAVGRASIEAQARHPRPREADPLPAPSAFASTFWRAVRYVDDAHEQMNRYGVGSLDLDADAREAALRLRRKAAEISAAVAEAFAEDSFTGREA